MRRITALALIALFLFAPSAPVWAQANIPGPGGIIVYNSASQSMANRTDEVTLFTYTVPAAMWATSAVFNATRPANLWPTTQWPVLAAAPLHLQMHGLLTTASGANLQIGVNFGGNLGTMTLSNGTYPAFTNQPWTLDVWLTPIATDTGSNTAFVRGRFAFGTPNNGAYTAGLAGYAIATEGSFNSYFISTTTVASAVPLNVLGRWGAAAAGNQFAIYERVLKIGP